LFDLANEVVDALAENTKFANLKTGLELMTKLRAAMYAYGARAMVHLDRKIREDIRYLASRPGRLVKSIS